MYSVPIPNWNGQGILPPYNNPAVPTSRERSPYSVSITDLVLRFAISHERITILSGLLKFRAALHAVGLVQGFQWIDGSFVEYIEWIEERPPRDIDVVTFYHTSQTQLDLNRKNPELFARKLNKDILHVDTLFVQLNHPNPEYVVKESAYWYSIWSHRRSKEWKGFLQIDLAPDEDGAAQQILNEKLVGIGGRS